MKLLSLAFFSFVMVMVGAPKAHAYVTYNRLGYVSCAACHTNPLGSGTLTPYGRGVGAAMSAWSREIAPEEKSIYAGLQARILGFEETTLNNPVLMQSDLLATAYVNPKLHFDAVAGANLKLTTTDFASVPSGSDAIVIRRALVTMDLNDEDSIQVGRDFAVQGLNLDDHTSFLKTRNRRNVLDYPTQVRFIRQTEKLQLVPYLMLPSYEESDLNREYGGGFRGEYVLNDHNSVGATALYGDTSQTSRASFGGFARLSQAHWNGFVAEGLFTRLNTHPSNVGFNQMNLYLRPFANPLEWVETSFIYEFLHVQAPYYKNARQFGPELNIRLHEYVSLIADGRKIINQGSNVSDWSWYGQVFVHFQM